jgi:hypothetical protein
MQHETFYLSKNNTAETGRVIQEFRKILRKEPLPTLQTLHLPKKIDMAKFTLDLSSKADTRISNIEKLYSSQKKIKARRKIKINQQFNTLFTKPQEPSIEFPTTNHSIVLNSILRVSSHQKANLDSSIEKTQITNQSVRNSTEPDQFKPFIAKQAMFSSRGLGFMIQGKRAKLPDMMPKQNLTFYDESSSRIKALEGYSPKLGPKKKKSDLALLIKSYHLVHGLQQDDSKKVLENPFLKSITTVSREDENKRRGLVSRSLSPDKPLATNSELLFIDRHHNTLRNDKSTERTRLRLPPKNGRKQEMVAQDSMKSFAWNQSRDSFVVYAEAKLK